MSAHTPGPWRERVATGNADRLIRGEGAGVCVIPYRYGTPESRGADARLIVTAPRLLAASAAAADVLDLFFHVLEPTAFPVEQKALWLKACAAYDELRAAEAEAGGRL